MATPAPAVVGSPQIPVIQQVQQEQLQDATTRRPLLVELGQLLGRPVVTYFTSFRFPVSIEDADADMLEGVLQKMDLSKGLALVINSPGGGGLAAERIVNVCRCMSGTGEFWAIVPNKAKSAATMICFGASKIFMGVSSELGPVDPQLTVAVDGQAKRYSLCNLVESYNSLFRKAINEKGNLQPYLQQLANYDAKDIQEYKAAISLSEDISIRTLHSGMMSGNSKAEIKNKIKVFLSPKTTKSHGRPIYRKEAATSGLVIESVSPKDKLWEIVYQLYIRSNNFVSTRASKCIESTEHAFSAYVPQS